MSRDHHAVGFACQGKQSASARNVTKKRGGIGGFEWNPSGKLERKGDATIMHSAREALPGIADRQTRPMSKSAPTWHVGLTSNARCHTCFRSCQQAQRFAMLDPRSTAGHSDRRFTGSNHHAGQCANLTGEQTGHLRSRTRASPRQRSILLELPRQTGELPQGIAHRNAAANATNTHLGFRGDVHQVGPLCDVNGKCQRHNATANSEDSQGLNQITTRGCLKSIGRNSSRDGSYEEDSNCGLAEKNESLASVVPPMNRHVPQGLLQFT